MKLERILMLLAAACVCFLSCKDEEDEDVANYKYISGSLDFSIPLYVKYGDEYVLTPTGVYHPEQTPDVSGKYRDTLGYYFLNPITNSRDTVKYFGYPATYPKGRTSKDYVFRISKDTLATFTLTGYAFAPDYYSASRSKPFTIVSDEGSLIGFPSYPEDGSVEIEGKTYPTVTIGGKQWMRRNLASENAGEAFAECPAMNDIFGRYYTWTEAQAVCPEGWELPSAEDWNSVYELYGKKMSSLLADVSFNTPSDKMWTLSYQVGTITDESHLSILSCGYGVRYDNGFKFSDAMKRAAFWTSGSSADRGEYVEFYGDRNIIGVGMLDKEEILFQVRCKQK